MTTSEKPAILSAAELIDLHAAAQRSPSPSLVIFDATPGARPTDPHIPGAFVADLDGPWSDQSNPLPHTLPAAEDFARLLASYGVSADTRVVVYEKEDIFAAARIWWMLRWIGVAHPQVLSGGLRAWRRAGGPVAVDPTAPAEPGSFEARPNSQMFVDEADVLAAARSGSHRILDARSRERFCALAPEPRPGLRSGHIPTSGSVPFTEVQEAGRFKTAEELREVLGGEIDDRAIITSCGSGVTASVLALALHLIGRDDVSVYDGSWSEWGRPDGPEIESSCPSSATT